MARRAASIAELKKQLRQKEKELGRLQARRKKLHGLLGKVEGQIAELEGRQLVRRRRAAGKARRGRPRKVVGEKTLRQAVAEVLGGTRKALGPKEIAEALPGVGYTSKSKNVAVIVGQVLSRSPEFRRVARGKYRLQQRAGRK